MLILGTYFSLSAIDLISDEDPTSIIPQLHRTVFISNTFNVTRKKVNMNAIIISENLTDFYVPGQYSRVVVLTSNSSKLLPLWSTSRIIDIVVLQHHKTKLLAYTWFPFRKRSCHKPPELEYVGECKNLTWGQNIFPKKIPRHFKKCPILYKVMPWAPDVVEDPPMSGNYSGREIDFMKILAESLGFQIKYAPTSFNFFFADIHLNETAMKMLNDGDVDFAFASMAMLDYYYAIAEPLPSYRDDPTVWMLPTPNPKDRTSSIYAGFSVEMWSLIVFTLLVSAILIIAVSLVEKCDWNLLNLVAVLVASPVSRLQSRLLRGYIITLQFYSLHIAWFYQSVLLKKLFTTPMEKQIKSVHEAVLEKGLIGHILPWLSSYFNTSDHEMWNTLLAPTNFLMALLDKDGPALRLKYRNSLDKLVYVLPFFVNKVCMYGIRGSPLIHVFAKQTLHLLESGVFIHLSALEPGYQDLKLKKQEGDAKVLDLECLFCAVILVFFGLVVAVIIVLV